MQLTFCSGRNVIFYHIVIIFYTSSVYPKYSYVLYDCYLYKPSEKSQKSPIPDKDEKMPTISLSFFPTDNSIQERRFAWEGLNDSGFVC